MCIARPEPTRHFIVARWQHLSLIYLLQKLIHVFGWAETCRVTSIHKISQAQMFGVGGGLVCSVSVCFCVCVFVWHHHANALCVLLKWVCFVGQWPFKDVGMLHEANFLFSEVSAPARGIN